MNENNEILEKLKKVSELLNETSNFYLKENNFASLTETKEIENIVKTLKFIEKNI